MTLRNAFSAALAALALIAASAGAALVLVTTRLHDTTNELANSIESVRLAGELQVELLVVDVLTTRALAGADPAVSSEIEERERALLADLARAGELVQSREEAEILASVREKVAAYLSERGQVVSAGVDADDAARLTRASFHAARSELRRLAEVNTQVARLDHEQAAAWDRAARRWGFGAAVLLVGGTALVLAWVRSRLFSPLLAIGSALSRFARGERSVRVSDAGAAEIHHVASSFNAMAAQLEDDRERQLAFVAAVAHDMRNPLAALSLATRTVRPDRPLPDERRLRTMLALVERQVVRLERLATDFLDTARIEAGQLQLSVTAADLRDVARAAADLYDDASPRHRLQLELPPEPVMVTCDPGRLEQIANNLVANAIKYSPDGGLVRIAVGRDGEGAALSVSDQGIGISREDLPHVFEPFRRVGALKRSVPGVGLGLANALKIAQAHGGRIAVESTPGVGSTFTLHVPASDEAAPRATA